MQSDRQKQQSSFFLPSSNTNLIHKTTSSKPKLNPNIQHFHLKTQSVAKQLFPPITHKQSQNPENHLRMRVKTDQAKSFHENSLELLKYSIHQYKNNLNMVQDRDQIASRIKQINQRLEGQYQTQIQHKLTDLSHRNIKYTQAFRLANDSRKKNANSSNMSKKDMTQLSITGQIQQWKQKFQSCVESIPKIMKNKTEETLNEPLKYLSLFNPFFQRNNQTTNLCLLKIGRIMQLKRTLLYKLGEESPYFYIILLGKVKIQNGNLVKQCQTGETLNEEIVFSSNQKKISLQKAKTLGKTYLLQVSVSEWAKLTKKMLSHGYKKEFNQTQALIKRNYIIKNWLRNKARKQNQV